MAKVSFCHLCLALCPAYKHCVKYFRDFKYYHYKILSSNAASCVIFETVMSLSSEYMYH